MISDIIKILQSDNFYNESEIVEFAKGSQEFTTSYKIFKQKIKRKWRLKKR